MAQIATNRRARHDYEILQTFEAGIALTGPEVRSAKLGRVQLTESFAKLDKAGNIYLRNCYIAPYERARVQGYDPYRPRQLLLHQNEIDSIKSAMQGQNLTITPIRMYTTRRGLIKVEIGLAKGKKKHEKRKKILDNELKRELARTLKNLPSVK